MVSPDPKKCVECTDINATTTADSEFLSTQNDGLYIDLYRIWLIAMTLRGTKMDYSDEVQCFNGSYTVRFVPDIKTTIKQKRTPLHIRTVPVHRDVV